jgi:hypothetical protein
VGTLGFSLTGNAPFGGEVIYLNTSLPFNISYGTVGLVGVFILDTVLFWTGEGMLGPTHSSIFSYLRLQKASFT